MSDFVSGLALIFYIIVPAVLGISGMIIYKLMELLKSKSRRVKASLIIALCLAIILVLLGYLDVSYEINGLKQASVIAIVIILPALGLATTFLPFEGYLGFRWHEICIFVCSMAVAAPTLFASAFFSAALYSGLNGAGASGLSPNVATIIMPLSLYAALLATSSVFYAIAAVAFQAFLMVKKRLIKGG